MRRDLKGGIALAKTGYIPVRIIGKIRKGTPIVSSDTPGCARAIMDNSELLYKLGIAMQDSDQEEEKLVMCTVGI